MSALTQLGPYRVVRLIGRGGMGEVYEAVHTGLDKRVALKVLPREMAAARRERFLREARLAAGLHHTNIVPVFDVGVADGLPYYAMQFIPGRPLGGSGALPSVPGTHTFDPDRTTDQTPGSHSAERVPKLEACRLILQAADGLAHAHTRGIVHRDVKPANLLVDDSGVVWVADFGLAFHEQDESLTADGAVLGTPRYMSPEQARAEKRIDARTDVFSLGVTLYELLTGRPAFAAESVPALLRQVQESSPPSPRSLDRGIPKDLDTLVQKAMAKRPADRYADAGELAADLRRYLAGEPVRARRIGAVGRAWRWAKRKPTVATLLGLMLFTFAAGAGASLYFGAMALRREREALKSQGELKETVRTLTEREEDVRRLGYTLRMTLAASAYQQKNFSRTRELLDDTTAELRGWEWRQLWRGLHPEPIREQPLPKVKARLDFQFGPDFLVIDDNERQGSVGGDGVHRGTYRLFDPETFEPTAVVPYRLAPRVGGWTFFGHQPPHYGLYRDDETADGSDDENDPKRFRLVPYRTGREVIVRAPPGYRLLNAPTERRSTSARFVLFDLIPEGKKVQDGTVGRVFDIARGQWGPELRGETGGVEAISRDDKWYVEATQAGLYIWSLTDPAPVLHPTVLPQEAKYEPHTVVVVAGEVAVARTKAGLVYIRSILNSAPPRELAVTPPGDGTQFSLDVSLDGRTAVVIGPKGEVYSIPLDPDRLPSLVRLYQEIPDEAFVRPDGGRLVMTAKGDAIEWDLRTPAARQVVSLAEGARVAQQREAQTKAGRHFFRTQARLDARNGRFAYLTETPLTDVRRTTVELVVRDFTAEGQQPCRLRLPPGYSTRSDNLHVSADGRRFAVLVHQYPFFGIAGGLIGAAAQASLSADLMALAFDIDTTVLLAVFDTSNDQPPLLVPLPSQERSRLNGFTSDGRILVRADNALHIGDPIARTWRSLPLTEQPLTFDDDTRMSYIPVRSGPDGLILAVDYHEDAKTASKSRIRIVAVDPARIAVVREFVTTGYRQDGVLYLPLTKQVVAAIQKPRGTDCVLHIWDWDSPATVPTVIPLEGPLNGGVRDAPRIITTSTGRAYVASGDRVVMFDLPAWSPAGRLTGMVGHVEHLALTPDEDRLLVVSEHDDNATLSVWDTTRRQLITSFPLGKLADGYRHFDFDGHTFRWLRKGYGEDVWLDSLDGR